MEIVAYVVCIMLLQIKKFKDALAKYSPDRCSLGPTKGLEEKELLALSSNRDLSFNYSPKSAPIPHQGVAVPEPAPRHPNSDIPLSLPLASPESARESEEKRTLVNSGR